MQQATAKLKMLGKLYFETNPYCSFESIDFFVSHCFMIFEADLMRVMRSLLLTAATLRKHNSLLTET